MTIPHKYQQPRCRRTPHTDPWWTGHHRLWAIAKRVLPSGGCADSRGAGGRGQLHRELAFYDCFFFPLIVFNLKTKFLIDSFNETIAQRLKIGVINTLSPFTYLISRLFRPTKNRMKEVFCLSFSGGQCDCCSCSWWQIQSFCTDCLSIPSHLTRKHVRVKGT